MRLPCSSISWRLLLPALKAKPPRATANYEAEQRTLLTVPTLRKAVATSREGHATSHALSWREEATTTCHGVTHTLQTQIGPQARNATRRPSSSLVLWRALLPTTKVTWHNVRHSHDQRCFSPSRGGRCRQPQRPSGTDRTLTMSLWLVLYSNLWKVRDGSHPKLN